MKRDSRNTRKSTKREPQRFLIVRHGESVANVDSILAGRIDPTPLTHKGKSDAAALAPVLRQFEPDLVLVSPLLRCRQTAELSYGHDYVIDERLVEMDYGRWTGKSLASLRKRPEWGSIQEGPASFTFPSGESFATAWRRLENLRQELVERQASRIALFSHGDISRMMITLLLERPLDSFQRILIEPASHSLLVAEAGELDPLGATVGYLNRLPSTTEVKALRGRYTPGGE